MNSIRITLAALALSATAFAQASEVTEFPITTSASVSRAAVQAEARRLVATDSLRYDELGPVAMRAPASTKTRDEVRAEIVSSRIGTRMAANTDLVGGM